MEMEKVQNRSSLGIIFISICLMIVGFTDIVEARKIWFQFSPETKFTYDSNIFLYSPDDIDNFVNRKNPEQFAAIESYDDAIYTQSAKGYLHYRWNSNWKTRARVNLRQRNYALNEQKNYYTVAFHLRQYYKKLGYLQWGYFIMPRYHIRPIYDMDSKTYEPCEYKDQLFSLKANITWKKSEFEIGYAFQIDDYNSFFREYDNESDRFLFGVRQLLKKRIKVKLDYEFKQLVADAVDEAGEDYKTSDDSDMSHDQSLTSIAVDGLKFEQLPVSFSTAYAYRSREYTTDNSKDSFHFERKDTAHEIKFGAKTTFSRRWIFTLNYEFDKRDVDSPEKERITDVKNYRKHTTNIGINFNYDTRR